jgi:LmbE family N-acetylglucosaminyl deacetylase
VPAADRAAFVPAVAFAALAAALAAVTGSAVLGAAAAPAAPRSLLEPFDPRSDYGYDLAATDAVAHAVELTALGFEWPAGVAGDTAFLEVDLDRVQRERPEIRLRHGEIELHQVFEDGARGRRFVDVSPFLRAGTPAGARVELEAEGARWRPGAAGLFAYRNAPIDGMRVLVVAPHPDDAEIAAFGVYSSADADVVTVTSGDAGAQGFAVLFPEPGEHYRVKGWIRTWDSITVPFFGGVPPGRARNLGYYDATLARMWRLRPQPIEPLLAALERPGFYRELNVDPALRARAFEATWPGLVGDLVAELERVQPRVVVAAHPLLDRHRDHQFTTVALLEALESWDGDCELWLYTNHAVQNESWPLGPRTAMTGLPPWPGGALFFSRLYSHPLDAAARKRKLVALEAMHDLRPFDLRDGAPSPAGSRELAAHARELELELRYDYFRRAPRPNELFFVATRADAARLRAYLMDRARALEALRLIAS